MKASQEIDVAVLIALDEEYRAFAASSGLAVDRDGAFEVIDMNGDRRRGIVTCFADMGPEAGNAAARKLFDTTQPNLVVVIGLAGQLDDAVQLGEIVVATEVDNYAFGSKIVSEVSDPSKLSIAWGGKTHPASAHPAKALESFSRDNPAVYAEWREQNLRFMNEVIPLAAQAQLSDLRLGPPRRFIHRGPVASGPWVGSSIRFKQLLKTRNRNFLALEMESAGALAAMYDRETWPTTLVLRVVSDPADERKKQIDNLVPGDAIRRWALHSAYSLLGTAFRRLPLWHDSTARARTRSTESAAILEELHSTVSVRHLWNAYRDELAPEMVTAVGSYVRLVSRCDNIHLPPGAEWETIAGAIYDSDRTYPLRVAGDAGTGKSTFLSTLYWYLKQRAESDETLPVPVFLNALIYDDALIDEGRRRPLTLVENEVKRDVDRVGDVIKSGRSVVAIVDGLDETAHFRRRIEDTLLELGNSATRKVVGVSVEDGGDAPIRASIQNPQAEITLLPIQRDSAEAIEVVAAFAAVVGAVPKDLSRRAAALELDTIDWATLSMIRRSSTSIDYRTCRTLTDVYLRWCSIERATASTSRPDGLLPLAQLAYDYTFARGTIDQTTVDPRDWRIIRSHENVRFCLVAWLVVEALIEPTIPLSRQLQVLDRVYTFRVNRFVKDRLAHNTSVQERMLRSIVQLYPDASTTVRTNLAYFAGRFDGDPVRDAAKKLLYGWLPGMPKVEKASRRELMLIRTCYVSLAKYGDAKQTAEYVRLMLKNHDLDDLNRGFHLEYYMDDVNFNPSVSDDHRDHLKPYPKTAERLAGKIEAALAQSRPSRELLDIEIHTLASLAQHRQAAGVLHENDRERTVQVLSGVIDSDICRTPELRTYLSMAVENLSDPTFTVTTPLERMFELKALPRRGWEVRHVPLPIETVASHSFGAFLIGFYFLPDHIAGRTDYNRDLVLRMVLLHDLGEAVIGDMLPSEKTSELRERERQWFGFMRMLSTYTDIANMRRSEDLFREFENASTINGQIAKDLDSLDALFQLLLYSARGVKIDDREKWIRSSVSALKTEEGIRIWQLIDAHFAASRDRSKQTWWQKGSVSPDSHRPRTRRRRKRPLPRT